jgi:hypothetical protein
MPQPKLDPVDTPPTITGREGRAWAIDFIKAYESAGKDRTSGAEVAGWIIEAAWAHPFWHSYWLQVVHLRPMPDDRPTKIYLEGATHELWLYALNPEKPRQAMLDGGQVYWLDPINFAAQLIERSDADAMQHAEEAVHAICDGNLSPDTDFRAVWVSLFGDNMMKEKVLR